MQAQRLRQTHAETACVLCNPAGEAVIWRDTHCRVLRVGGNEGREFPGYCRVIWQAHVAEMSALTIAAQQHLMAVVFAVEAALREVLAPDKINLASLGNQVPHLHWHVIPRWRADSHFPDAIWAPPQRPVWQPPRRPTADEVRLAATVMRRCQAAAL